MIAQFCERWDQSSFDPDYESLTLEFFRPMVHEVFARTPYDPEILQSGVRAPLQNTHVAASRT